MTFSYTKYSSTSSTDKYVLKYKYQVQVLYLTPTLIDRSKNCITYISITVNDVKTIVSQLNNSAAGPDDLPAGPDDLPAGPDDLPAGPDDLPPTIMKQVSNEYCIPLAYFINLSVLQGGFPSEMKLAKFTIFIKLTMINLFRTTDLFPC